MPVQTSKLPSTKNIVLNSEEDDHLDRASQDKYYEPQSEDEGSEQERVEQEERAEEDEETAEGAGKDSNPRKRVREEGSEAEGTAEGDKRSSQNNFLASFPPPPPAANPFEPRHGWIEHPSNVHGIAADVAQTQRKAMMNAIWSLRKEVAELSEQMGSEKRPKKKTKTQSTSSQKPAKLAISDSLWSCILKNMLAYKGTKVQQGRRFNEAALEWKQQLIAEEEIDAEDVNALEQEYTTVYRLAVKSAK